MARRVGSSGLFWSLKSCSFPKTSCRRRPVFSHKLSSGARLRWARWIVSAALRSAAYRCRAVAIRDGAKVAVRVGEKAHVFELGVAEAPQAIEALAGSMRSGESATEAERL